MSTHHSGSRPPVCCDLFLLWFLSFTPWDSSPVSAIFSLFSKARVLRSLPEFIHVTNFAIEPDTASIGALYGGAGNESRFSAPLLSVPLSSSPWSRSISMYWCPPTPHIVDLTSFLVRSDCYRSFCDPFCIYSLAPILDPSVSRTLPPSLSRCQAS